MANGRHSPVPLLPSWVEAPTQAEGSIDPLGYSAKADEIAAKILPGVTVQTTRARYLSFLCWAVGKCGKKDREIDRWEIALSVGEYLRHGRSTECSYFGPNLLHRAQYRGSDGVPKQLHVQTARILYSGLLRSCGLITDNRELTPLGEKLADCFDKCTPKTLPATVAHCRKMPCLSQAGAIERRYLRQALIGQGTDRPPDSETRLKTFKSVGTLKWKRVWSGSHTDLIKLYLEESKPKDDVTADLVEAATFELHALPLTRLFLALYNNEQIPGVIPAHPRFLAFEIPREQPAMLAGVAAHLREAEKRRSLPVGLQTPITVGRLKDFVLERHREAKADDPWVDENWRQLRRNLMPAALPGVHAYRLSAFASLLVDIGEIRR